MPATRTFLFAGGGTGGHIYPALAIAEQLKSIDPACRAIFLCSPRAVDSEILRREKANFRVIPARPFGVRPKALLAFAASWGAAIRATRTVVKQFAQDGSRVEMVAMGGFVAAPCAQAAQISGLPLTLVNMDAVPGKANRWIARRAQRVFTSCEVIGKAEARAAAWQRVGPIVRSAAVAPGDAAECRRRLGLDPARPVLLVTGASQGARSINRLALRVAGEQHAHFTGHAAWQIVHQTGAGEDEAVRAAYRGRNIAALVQPFFDPMGVCWGAADLALSRAGAGSVAEAWANRTPTVFMPYPYHRDQHQRFNAEPLARAGGAMIATDHIDEAINATAEGSAGRTLVELLAAPARVASMRQALAKLGPADGARAIAQALLATPTDAPARAG